MDDVNENEALADDEMDEVVGGGWTSFEKAAQRGRDKVRVLLGLKNSDSE